MFKKKETEPTELDNAITDLFDGMADVSGDSAEYAAMATQLERLYKLKQSDNESKSNKLAWAEVLVPSAASIAGIVMIVGHERAHVITSKALNLLMKLR